MYSPVIKFLYHDLTIKNGMEESLVSVANFILDPNIYNHIRLKNSPEKKSGL